MTSLMCRLNNTTHTNHTRRQRRARQQAGRRPSRGVASLASQPVCCTGAIIGAMRSLTGIVQVQVLVGRFARCLNDGVARTGSTEIKPRVAADLMYVASQGSQYIPNAVCCCKAGI